MKNLTPRYYGEWPRLELRLLLAYQGEPPPANRRMLSTNGFYSFWYVEKGPIEVRSGNNEWILKTSDWILFPSFFEKYQNFSSGSRILSLGFEAAWSGELSWLQFEKPVLGKIRAGDALLISARNLIQILAGNTGDGYKALPERKINAASLAELQGGLFNFVARLTPILLKQGAQIATAHSRDPRIARIISELQSRPSIHPLPYAHWKQMVQLSRVQIDRLFQSEFGNSPRSQRDRYLLAAIKSQLMTRPVSVKETAALFGFSDSSHFCRWFRQYTSMSPEEFRLHGIG